MAPTTVGNAVASARAASLVGGGGDGTAHQTPAASKMAKNKNSNANASPDWSVGTASSTVCSSVTGDGSVVGSFLGTSPSATAELHEVDDQRRLGQNETSVLMVPPANDDGNATDDLNLMRYLGQGAIQRSADDPHVEIALRAFERRVYLSKQYTNTKEDKDGLKKLICNM